jgi:hypothetical protein
VNPVPDSGVRVALRFLAATNPQREKKSQTLSVAVRGIWLALNSTIGVIVRNSTTASVSVLRSLIPLVVCFMIPPKRAGCRTRHQAAVTKEQSSPASLIKMVYRLCRLNTKMLLEVQMDRNRPSRQRLVTIDWVWVG